MDRYKFEVDDVTKLRIMRIQCTYCSKQPKLRPAIIFHGKMTTQRDSDDKNDVIAIFCQGGMDCEGNAWAFPSEPDSGIIRKHNALEPLNTDN